MVKNSYIEKTYCLLKVHTGIASKRQFQCVPTTYITENKEENNLEMYIFQVSSPLSNKYPKLPIRIKNSCHSTANYLYLYDSYISKFEFTNYLFAILLVAWLYIIAIIIIKIITIIIMIIIIIPRTIWSY